VLSDGEYINAMSKQMKMALNDYLTSVVPVTGDPGGISPPPTPAPPDYSDVEVFLSFLGIGKGKGAEILLLLNNVYQFKACFL
jgi:hypothetical protein